MTLVGSPRGDGGRRVRVLVVDGQPLFRRGVASALSAEGVFEVVGEAGDGHGAIAQVRALAPDVVLMDVCATAPNAAEAAAQITAAAPTVKILALTASPEDGRGLDAMKAGADRYVPKDVDPTGLVAAIRAVVRGDPFVTPAMAVKLLEESGKAPEAGDGAAGDVFTPRERDVLHLLARGIVNGAIAAHLRVGETAVKNHLRSIVDKLRAQTCATAEGSQPGAVAPASGDARDPARRRGRRFELSAGDRELLQQLLRSPIIPDRIAVRARIVLGAGEGWSNYRIARECATTRPTVLLWRRRYIVHGIRGLLVDAPRPGRPPRRRTPSRVAAGVEAALATIEPLSVDVTAASLAKNGARVVPVLVRA